MSEQHDVAAIEEGLIALHRASFQHKAWEELQRTAGVTLDRAGAALLKTVAHSDTNQCRMHDIAQRLGIEAPSVTRKVQELEQEGLVTRSVDPHDRRVSQVQLTRKGQQRLQKLQEARRQRLIQVLQHWPASERQTLAKLLQKFADDLLNQ